MAGREYKNYKKGEIIFKQGDPADRMYDIRWGTVGIYLNYGTPREKMLAELRGDDIFGEMGLVDNAPRSATAVALDGETKLEIITKETFSGYLKERPEKVIAAIQSMSRRIRSLTNDYMEACRAVAEAVESDDGGNFRSPVTKFVENYRETAGKTGDE